MNKATPTNGTRGADHIDRAEAMLPGPVEPLEHAQELLLEANARVLDFVKEHPVPCLIGAVAVGYVVGRAAAKRWL